ncbi:MAG TPA: hypothetical protein VNN07_00210 [Candidatus Tectomicrobia bacterium]|nr:hypothetical protein [Candidatus Tectomicrobia bacterium]
MNMLTMLSVGAVLWQPVRAVIVERVVGPIAREIFFRRLARRGGRTLHFRLRG